MPEEIDVACPGCNAIFGVPVSFCGQTAECAECGSMFEIPHLREKNLEDTSTGTISGLESDGETTNTVRLSRSGIGMIPQIKDDYKLGAVPGQKKKPAPISHISSPSVSSRPQSPNAPKPPAPKNSPTVTSKPIQNSPTPMPTAAGSAQTVQDIPAQPQVQGIPEWTNIRVKKGEEIIGVREVVNSPAEIAFLVVIPLIIAGAAGLLSPKISTMVSAMIVGASCVITFIVALIMNKNNSKKALVVTNQRAIAVIGKNRIEIKK
jgi:hypothetical protein